MCAYCIEADDSGLFLAMTHKVTVLLAGDQTLLRVDCSVLCDNMTTLYIHSFGRDPHKWTVFMYRYDTVIFLICVHNMLNHIVVFVQLLI